MGQLEGAVQVNLQKLERYYRVGQNGNDVVAINEDWDRTRSERMGGQAPLNSLRSVIILMLKELSDQNPKALRLLENKWQMEQRNETRSGALILKKSH